LWSWGYVR